MSRFDYGDGTDALQSVSTSFHLFYSTLNTFIDRVHGRRGLTLVDYICTSSSELSLQI